MTENDIKTGDRAWLPMLVGLLALVALVGGLGYWSATAKLSGAVVASGVVQVETNRQVIQHPDGGVVGAILARNGDVVEAGDVLVQFDPTRLQLELNVVEGQLHEFEARIARLQAERDGAQSIIYPEHLIALARTRPEVAEQIEGQEQQFVTGLKAHDQELQLLDETIKQLENRVEGLDAQLTSVDMQSRIIGDELKTRKDLLDRGLGLGSEVAKMELEEASLIGERGKIIAEIAEHKGQMAAVNIERIKLETNRSQQAIQRLRDMQYSVIELNERQKDLTDSLSRLDVRAPVSGVVYGSQVFALQSVVRPAESIMYIVPQDQNLVISTRISTSDIDQVHVGQDATLRFTAFNQRQTPEVAGYVSFVAADAAADENTGRSYYVVELLPDEDQLDRLGGQVLLPGMPVEGFITTDARTPLVYLTKPLTDYFQRAFRG